MPIRTQRLYNLFGSLLQWVGSSQGPERKRTLHDWHSTEKSKNRVPRSVRDKIFEDSVDRGVSRLIVRDDSGATVTAWKDSKTVLVLSSAHGIVPETTCKRWVKGAKTKKTFRQPDSISK